MQRGLTRRLGIGVWSLALITLAFAGTSDAVRAQGVQTGIVTGVVRDADDLVMPGVTVVATSPAMQGSREAVTDGTGAYILRGLPPGQYVVKFELAGMATVEQSMDVPLGGTVRIDATMQLETLAEVVTVAAEYVPPALSTTQSSSNFRAEIVNTLPVGRSPFLIAELSPGMTANTPNVGQVTIGGAFAFDSIFLIDGVDTNDNLFGSSHGLFIEDAIQETQVVRSGVSAEYGRFGGGVVNVITRSGGNQFSGSFRSNLSRPSWSRETPFERENEQERSDELSSSIETTLGGPVLRDRLWFFNANRFQDSSESRPLSETGTSYTEGTNNKRFELKLTGTPVTNHTVSGTYLRNSTDSTSRPSINADFSSDLATLVDRQNPNDLWVANWQGVLSPSVLATFQFSRKQFGFRNTGGTSTAILDSPFLTRGQTGMPVNRHYNAPYFSSHDPEDRNNRQFAGSVSSFFSHAGTGRHDLKAGFEHFTSARTGGNSQSATDYVFQTDWLVGPDGSPVIGADGGPIPVWRGNAASPAAAGTRIQNWLSVPGSQLDIRTLSLYVQDRWTVNNHLNLDIGARYERVRSEATGDIIGADTDALVPRLGATFDPVGDGHTVFQATYGHYSGRYTERALGRNTSVGTPSLLLLAYTGPDGVGKDFAPGFDLDNYAVIGGNFPTANVFFDDDLSSPLTKEFTASVGRQLPRGGYAKVMYVWRRTNGFIEDFIDDPNDTGKVDVIFEGQSFGTVDRVLYRNSDAPTREYQDVQFEGRLPLFGQLYANGSWTVQLKNHGDFPGEAANQPGNTELFHNYPELFNLDRYMPYGRLPGFQRHKVRLWTTYNLGLGRAGSVDLSPIWRIDSGLVYSLAAPGVPHTDSMLSRNPGYLLTGGSGQSATLFFGERGSQTFKGAGLLDLAVNYQIPVWRELRPWLQVHVYNTLDNQKQTQWNTSVTPDWDGPLDADGLPTQYVEGATFGQATSANHFPLWAPGSNGGRTFRLALGFRF